MPDDSALRATLEELKELQDSDEARRPAKKQEAAGETPAFVGGSLLDDLLNETSGEAQREVEEIRSQLADKKAAEAAARKESHARRRAQLDALREQESQRREAMIQRRERQLAHGTAGPAPEKAPESVVEHVSVVAAPQKSSNAGLFAIAAVLFLGLLGAGWLFWLQQHDAKQSADASQQTPAEVAETAPVKTAEKAATAAPEPAAAKPAAAVPAKPAVVALAVEFREIEPEADGYPRRMVELMAPRSGKRGGKARRGGKRGGAKRGGKRGGKRIRIRALNLGGSK